MTKFAHQYTLVKNIQEDTTSSVALYKNTTTHTYVIIKTFNIPMARLDGIDFNHELNLMLYAQQTPNNNCVKLINFHYVDETGVIIPDVDIHALHDGQLTLPIHPNINESLSTSKYLHLIIEYMNAGSVSDLLDKYPSGMRESFISFITQQILFGLKVLHEQNIAHRDVKPENFLICNTSDNSSATVKLGDYGIAYHTPHRAIEEDIVMNDFIGTLHYISPQIAKRQRYTQRADFWALGVSVLEMLLGAVPYNTMNGLEFARDVVGDKDDEYNPLHHITMDQYQNLSDQAKDFLKACFEYEENDRPATADVLLNMDFIKKYESFDMGRLLCKIVTTDMLLKD